MKVLILKVRRHSLLSAVYSNQVLSQSCEYMWNSALGFSHLTEVCQTIAEQYEGYDCVALCLLPMLSRINSKLLLSHQPIKGYYPMRLQEILEKALQRPVYAFLRAHSATVGEAVLGNGMPYESLLFVEYGNQIYSGIWHNGALITGNNGYAGIIGHMTLHPEGIACICGAKGCYEQYATPYSLVETAQTMDSRITSLPIFIKELKTGNLTLTYIFESWVAEVVLGLSNAIYIIDPKAVMLGGEIFQDSYVFEQVVRSLRQHLLYQYKEVPVVAATYGPEVTLKGTALLAQQEYALQKHTKRN